MLAGRSVGRWVEGRSRISLAAAKQKAENFQNRLKADPVAKCYFTRRASDDVSGFPLPDFPNTDGRSPMTFEWSLVYRLVYTDGSPHPVDIESWMGDSRGRLGWRHAGGGRRPSINDKTWLDMAGDFHSAALHVVERYRMTDRRYDPVRSDARRCEGFHQAWTIRHSAEAADGSGPGCSSTCARRNWKKQTARSRGRSGHGIRAMGNRAPEQSAVAAMAVRLRRARQLRENRGRISAGPLTRSRIFRGFTNRTAAARITAWKSVQVNDSTYRADEAWSSIRRTGCCRCSRGRSRKGSSATCRNAAMTIRRRTVSRPGFHGRCMSRRAFIFMQTSEYLVVLHERIGVRRSCR